MHVLACVSVLVSFVVSVFCLVCGAFPPSLWCPVGSLHGTRTLVGVHGVCDALLRGGRWKVGLRPRAIYSNNGQCCFFPSSRGRAEAALVCSCPGVLLTAPTSGLCEVSLPGLALLTARGQKGTGGALPGCGQRTGAAAAEAGETRESGRKRKSRPSVQHPPPSAGRESLPLCVRKEPSSQSDRQRAPRVCVRHPKRGTAA